MSKGAVITKSLGTPALANPYVVTNSWYYQLGILQATSKGTKMTGWVGIELGFYYNLHLKIW